MLAAILHAVAGAIASQVVKALLAHGWLGRVWAWLRPGQGKWQDACVVLWVWFRVEAVRGYFDCPRCWKSGVVTICDWSLRITRVCCPICDLEFRPAEAWSNDENERIEAEAERLEMVTSRE